MLRLLAGLVLLFLACSGSSPGGVNPTARAKQPVTPSLSAIEAEKIGSEAASHLTGDGICRT